MNKAFELALEKSALKYKRVQKLSCRNIHNYFGRFFMYYFLV